MSTLKVFWYQHQSGHGNFGDELNPYIIERLSGKKVENTATWSGTKIDAIKIILHQIFVQKKLKDFYHFPEWNTVFGRKIIFAIGSIIGCSTENVVVWGSGIIERNEIIPYAKFFAVRGKYTQNRIEELRMSAPQVIGDPALLLPLIFRPNINKSYSIGIIPHYVHYEAVKEQYSGQNFLIINLLDPVEKVIEQICSCRLTLSTSLHGIIVSHAYRIPSVWVHLPEISDTKLAGDDIKFADYFSSVNLQEYLAVSLDPHKTFEENFDYIWKKYRQFSLPEEKVISEIQKKLLTVAPFPLSKNFFKIEQ